jgi:hypothetical protein
MSRWTSRTTASALLLALAFTTSAAAAGIDWPWRKKFEDGEVVRFAGTVTGPDGAPMANVAVAVEGWRSDFVLSEFAVVREGRTRLVATTDARGAFALDWIWDRSLKLKKFAIVAYVPYRGARGQAEHELARVDITRRLRDGSPVTATLGFDPAGVAFLNRLRAFESSLTTADERSVYQELGLPEQVDRTRVGDQIESAWWYFTRGRVCRFRDGVRTEMQSFPPVGAEPDQQR